MALKDLFLTPLFVFIIIQILFQIKKRECRTAELKKYFIPAACAKIVGAVALGLVYYFYYKGGDTIQYYKGASIINKIFFENPLLGIQALMHNCTHPLPSELIRYLAGYTYISDNGSFFIVRIAGLLSLFDFNSYVVTSIFFGMFSFSGSWALYRTLLLVYPNLFKELAYAIFFVPSVIFWGSGMLKDSLTFGALGWFFYGFYHIFIARDHFKKPAIMLSLGVFILIQVKIYILMSLVPALAVWLFLTYNERIKSRVTRTILLPVLMLVSLGFGILATSKIAQQDQQYKFDNLTKKAKITNEWLSYMSKLDRGSYYDIGLTDYSPMGLVKIFPKAVNVTLFRPYLWEARNPVMLMSAIESLFFLCFTIYTIWKLGFSNFISIIRSNPMVIAFLIFSVGMSFAVGITSANFGTLVRYKIPIMPFYMSSFLIITHIFKVEKAKKRQKRMAILDAQRF